MTRARHRLPSTNWLVLILLAVAAAVLGVLLAATVNVSSIRHVLWTDQPPAPLPPPVVATAPGPPPPSTSVTRSTTRHRPPRTTTHDEG